MKVTGQPDLHDFGDEVHYRQPPGPQENWQDSVVLTWWDEENAVGGFHRLGHQPNMKGGGKITTWNYLWSPEGIYKKTGFNDLREVDLIPGGHYGNGDDTCRCEFIDGQHIWTIEDKELETSARLCCTDISGNVDCFPKGQSIEAFTSAHFDVPGKVTGWLETKGKRYEVKGLGVRDHGWGSRDWASVFSHRWVAGCGPDLSFIAVTWHSIDENIMSFGWVIRENEVTFAKELDVVAYIEADSATNRGGHLTYKLTNGEVLEIECKALPVKGVVSYHNTNCVVERMCTWTCGSSKGICDFESSSNMQQGARRPKKFTSAHIENGFFPN
jgi:hypothetical protein